MIYVEAGSEQQVVPSKILAFTADIEGEPIRFITAHSKSRRGGGGDTQRLAQATVDRRNDYDRAG